MTGDNHAFQVESQAIARLSSALVANVLPLFVEVRGGKPKLIGSSFLISSGISSYLVSAAHVFDEMKGGQEIFFYIGPRTKQKLSGSLRLTKTGKGENIDSDRLDVGVLKFEGSGLPFYPNLKKLPLSIGALMPNALPREGKQYLVVGFPESKSRANPVAREVVSMAYCFRNFSIPAGKYADLGFDPQSHLVLGFDRKRTIGPNGQIRAFPAPLGMSGSPVWLLHDADGPNDPAQTPVVGVAIEHDKAHHVMVVTDISIALQLINETL